MRRKFIELPSFTRMVSSGEISERMLRAIQNDIMQTEADTIAGTGGLKKIRSGGSGRGKRGGVRVVFADYPRQGSAVLITAYFKNVRENLTPQQCRALADLKARLDRQVGGF